MIPIGWRFNQWGETMAKDKPEIYSYNEGVAEEAYWSIKAPESKELESLKANDGFKSLPDSIQQQAIEELERRLEAPRVEISADFHTIAWSALKKLDRRANGTRGAARAATKVLAAEARSWKELEEVREVTEMTHSGFKAFLEGGKNDQPVKLSSELQKKLDGEVAKNKEAYNKRQASKK